MNPLTYINSGILELYALNQLDPYEREEAERMMSVFPEIRAELEKIQAALETYAASNGVLPHPGVKGKIMDSISNLEKERVMDPLDLPLITKFSDHTRWLELVNGMIPEKLDTSSPFIHLLQESTKATQLLVVSATDIPDEVHRDLHESFLILKGRCKCTVGNDVRFMEAGDFMAIPLFAHHDVEVLSESVVAVLQRVPV